MFNSFNPDLILFQRIQADDRKALNELFQSYYSTLCRFSFSYVKNLSEAEECVSDIFFTLWKNRKHLMINTSLRAYLYTSVRNASLAVIKKKNPQHEDIDDHTGLEDSFHADRALLYQELEEVVQDVIINLPDRCGEVYRLSRIDGLSYREISLMLCISENTVENHLVKALHLMRTAIRLYGQKGSGHNTSLTF